MIQMIGGKKMMLLGGLFALNAVLGAAIYLYLMPQNLKSENELRSLRGQLVQRQEETERLRTEQAMIQEQKGQFENLKAIGFFSGQNRILAQRRIEEVQAFTNILTAKYEISAATVEPAATATEAGYVLLDSHVQIDVDAMDDVDLYSFIYWIENTLPGHVAMNSFSANRTRDIDDIMLRQIGSGIPTTVMQGKIEFDWRTMLPESEVANYGAVQ